MRSTAGWMRSTTSLDCLSENDIFPTMWQPPAEGTSLRFDPKLRMLQPNGTVDAYTEVPAGGWRESPTTTTRLAVFSAMPVPAAAVTQSPLSSAHGVSGLSVRVASLKRAREPMHAFNLSLARGGMANVTGIVLGSSSLASSKGTATLSSNTTRVIDFMRTGSCSLARRAIEEHGLHAATFGSWTPPVDVSTGMVIILCSIANRDPPRAIQSFRCDDERHADTLLASRALGRNQRAGYWASPRSLWEGMVWTGVADTLLGVTNPLQGAVAAADAGWFGAGATAPECATELLQLSDAQMAVRRA